MSLLFSASVKTFKTGTQLHSAQVAVLNNTSAGTPRTAATIAGLVGGGLSTQESQHRLSMLVDEGLIARVGGNPDTATYTTN